MLVTVPASGVAEKVGGQGKGLGLGGLGFRAGQEASFQITMFPRPIGARANWNLAVRPGAWDGRVWNTSHATSGRKSALYHAVTWSEM